MVKGDIIGGLKIALSRGDPLQKAMQSFYNAGYTKEEIEAAARVLNTEGFHPATVSIKPRIQLAQGEKLMHPEYQPPMESEPTQMLQAKQPPISLQKPVVRKSVNPFPQPAIYPSVQRQAVSVYAQQEKEGGVDFVTIILIVILVVLLGILVAVFFYKEPLHEFLNGLFS